MSISRNRKFVEKIRKEWKQRLLDKEIREFVEKATHFASNVSGHEFVYLMEIIQNAIDAGARNIRIQSRRSSITIEHDGRAFEDRDIRSISQPFSSTKGLGSIGYMGIGFKSVFVRFRTARLHATSGWHVVLHVGDEVDGTGIQWTDLLLPSWDEAGSPPRGPYTTRFVLEEPRDSGRPLRDDLERAGLLSLDPVLLACLATRGLEELQVDGATWRCKVHEATRPSARTVRIEGPGNERHELLAVRSVFEPSRAALNSLARLRGQKPDKRHPAAPSSHEIWLYATLDEQGRVVADQTARLVAGLPLEQHAPFALSVNAPWIPDSARQHVKGVEPGRQGRPREAWYQELFEALARLVAEYLGWAATHDEDDEALRGALGVLRAPDPESDRPVDRVVASSWWRQQLRKAIGRRRVVPALRGGERVLLPPGEALRLPAPLARVVHAFPDMAWDEVFGAPPVDPGVLEPDGGALEWMVQLGLLGELDLDRTGTPEAMARWWDSIDDEQQKMEAWRRYLEACVVLGLHRQDGWAKRLPVRTRSGKWRSASDTFHVEEGLIPDRKALPHAYDLLRPLLPGEDEIVDIRFAEKLKQVKYKLESNYYEYTLTRNMYQDVLGRQYSIKKNLISTIHSKCTPEQLVEITSWIVGVVRDVDYGDMITHVVVEDKGKRFIVPVDQSRLSTPYCGRPARDRLFAEFQRISRIYEKLSHLSRSKWKEVFESAGCKGPMRFRDESRKIHDQSGISRIFYENRYDRIRDLIDSLKAEGKIGVSISVSLKNFFSDTLESLDEAHLNALADWLGEEMEENAEDCVARLFWSYYGNEYERRLRPEEYPTSWVQKLEELAWVPCDDGELHRPRECLLKQDPEWPGAPVARLDRGLKRRLERVGLRFGTALDAPVVARLQRLLKATKDARSARRLARLELLLKEAAEAGAKDEKTAEAVRRVLLQEHGDKPLWPRRDDGSDSSKASREALEHVPLGRVVNGAGVAATLGGYLCPLGELKEEVARALRQLDVRFPERPTAKQARGFLKATWRAARNAGGHFWKGAPPAEAVAAAYEALAESDGGLEWLRKSRSVAWVRTREGAWVPAAPRSGGASPVLECSSANRAWTARRGRLPVVRRDQLGTSAETRARVADALGIRAIEETAAPVVEPAGEPEAWGEHVAKRFDALNRLLAALAPASEGEGGRPPLTLRRAWRIEAPTPGGRPEQVAALAWDGALYVAADDLQDVMEDVAWVLVHHYGVQRIPDLALDVAGLVAALQREGDVFERKLDALRRRHALSDMKPVTVAEDPGEAAGRDVVEAEHGGDEEAPPEPTNPDPDDGGPRRHGRKRRASGGTGARHGRARSHASEKATAPERGSAPGGTSARSTGWARQRGSVISASPRRQGGGPRSDEPYRRAVQAYERLRGRRAEAMGPNHEGFDIRSVDEHTGEVRRLIEVKGVDASSGRSWRVELTPAQVRCAASHVRSKNENGEALWWLYVVLRQSESTYEVLTIPNPLDGQAHLALAEDCKELANDSVPIELGKEIEESDR